MTNHVGEECVVHNLPHWLELNGRRGVVRGLGSSDSVCAVEFPVESLSDSLYLHSCDGLCARGRGYFINEDFLQFAPGLAKASTIGEFLSTLRGRAEAPV